MASMEGGAVHTLQKMLSDSEYSISLVGAYQSRTHDFARLSRTSAALPKYFAYFMRRGMPSEDGSCQ